MGDSGQKLFLVWHFQDPKMLPIISNQATKKPVTPIPPPITPPIINVKSRKTKVTKTGTREAKRKPRFCSVVSFLLCV